MPGCLCMVRLVPAGKMLGVPAEQYTERGHLSCTIDVFRWIFSLCVFPIRCLISAPGVLSRGAQRWCIMSTINEVSRGSVFPAECFSTCGVAKTPALVSIKFVR